MFLDCACQVSSGMNNSVKDEQTEFGFLPPFGDLAETCTN